MELVYGLLLAGLMAIWVYQDARARGEPQPGLWAFGTLLLAILVVPIWLVKRGPKISATLRPCPHCAEPIQPAAKICRFCQREVEVLASEVAQATTASPNSPATKTCPYCAQGIQKAATICPHCRALMS